MQNQSEIIKLLDDASRAITEAKRQLTDAEDTHDEFEDVPQFQDWDVVNDNKWRCRLGHLELVIKRLDGNSYWWHIRDRRKRRRVASGCKGRHSARQARHSARRWYLEYQRG